MATHIAFRRQPSGAASGQLLDYPPILEALNVDNSVDTSYNSAVTLSGTGVGGTTSISFANGVAQYVDTVLTGTSPVVITATSGVMSANSSAVTPITPQFDRFALSHGVYIELPRLTPSTAYPTISSSVTVGAGKTYASVQAALDALVAADTTLHREIICSNSELVGASVVCPTRAAGMGKIIIRAVTLPAANARIIRGSAEQLALPRISSEAPGGLVTCADGTHDIYFVGIWFDVPVPASGDSFEYLAVVDFSTNAYHAGSGTIAATTDALTFSTSQAATPYFGPGTIIVFTDDLGNEHNVGLQYWDGATKGTLAFITADKFGNPAQHWTFSARSWQYRHAGNPLAQPYNMGVDRCYLNGKPTARVRKGIIFGGPSQFITNSVVDEIHDFFNPGNPRHPSGSVIGGVSHYGNGNGDTNAVASYFTAGPLLVHNNTLEGAGENVAFGGTDAPFPNLIPSDITITRNLIRKPSSWQGVYPEKNNFEVKNVRRVLLEGNIHDGTWIENQAGTGILLNVQHQNGMAPWTTVRDVTMRYSYTRNLQAFIAIDANAADTWLGVPATAISIHDVVSVNVNGVTPYSADNENRAVMLAAMTHTIVRHNTILAPAGTHTKGLILTLGPSNTTYFDDNICICDSYGIFGDVGGAGSGAVAWGLPDDPFVKNVLIAPSGSSAFGGSGFPASNYYPATMADVGFTDASISSSWDTADPDTVCAAFALANSSTYKGAATDGTDPGADIESVRNAIAGVYDGVVPPSITVHGRQRIKRRYRLI